MTDVYITLHSALIDLQCELKNLNLWETQRPADEALASTQPFCIDTLSFPQWLQ
ncbi:MAG: YqcC family protein, partial [Pseudomonadota bacterium]|nr:YqcC family protein [Pseudomonadota bacterium]